MFQNYDKTKLFLNNESLKVLGQGLFFNKVAGLRQCSVSNSFHVKGINAPTFQNYDNSFHVKGINAPMFQNYNKTKFFLNNESLKMLGTFNKVGT